MKLALSLALLTLAVGCKSRIDPSRDAIVKVQGFTTKMCNCADKACADGVNEEYTKWGTEIAKHATPDDVKPDPAIAKELTEAATRYAECYTKLAQVPAPVAEPPKPIEPPADAGLPGGYSDDVSIETLIADARQFLEQTAPDLAIAGVDARYVRASGIVDPKYGVVTIVTHNPDRPPTEDDPDRPTGAPIAEPTPQKPPRQHDCPILTFTKGNWSHRTGFCTKVRPVSGPRCPASDIWARAIGQGAPDTAVAILTIGYPHDASTWRFQINDPLRKVNFQRAYKDDCQVTIEK